MRLVVSGMTTVTLSPDTQNLPEEVQDAPGFLQAQGPRQDKKSTEKDKDFARIHTPDVSAKPRNIKNIKTPPCGFWFRRQQTCAPYSQTRHIWFTIGSSMIEVEVKYLLKEDDERRLLAGAVFLKEEILEDIYYDTPDFALTRSDRWLRLRNGIIELKLGSQEHNRPASATTYREVTDEEELRQLLALPAHEPLPRALEQAGYAPFCFCRTLRRAYRKGNITIVIDKADFEGFSYAIAEMEVEVAKYEDVERARQRLEQFAREHGLAPRAVLGKVLAYLKHARPHHYKALVKAGAAF
ncbi:MAG: hypothetical protein KatS3mg099_333 [Candidatus Parcubacteria bacterium]|nr:MAG: hypothetical protein KatS3mg099_333 [Candidatus Parcubacteria bacterium]